MGKLGLTRWASALPALLAGLLAGCQSGGGLPGSDHLSVDVPAEMVAGEAADWTVSWENFGRGPYTVAMDMGGGMTQDLPETIASASPFTSSFTPISGDYAQTQSYTYSVTVSDGRGETLSATGSYAVYTPPPEAPSIDSVEYQGSVLTVSVSSPAEIPLTVTVTEPTGLAVDSESKLVEGGLGEAVFNWSPTDLIKGAQGETTITVTDDYGGTDTATAEIAFPGFVGPGILLAVPVADEIRVNEPVMIVVISSWLPTEAPFAYMNAVSVTIDEGVEFMEGSINLGIPGGEEDEPDGIWATLDPTPTSFIDVNPDFFFPEHQWVEPLGNGRVMITFNLTPIDGGETYDGGALFNFQIKCTRPGTYTLGFEEFRDLPRTYYSDGESTEYYWADISNDYPGVPNSITVS